MNRIVFRSLRPTGAWPRLVLAALVGTFLLSAAASAADAPPGAAKAGAGAKAAAPQPKEQASFETPEAAAAAVANAARAMSGPEMLGVLGAGARDTLILTDKVAMRAEWARFVEAYDLKHAIQPDGPDRAKLTAGQDDWVFPYPLVRVGGRWRFDTEAGNEEVVARRIGGNELFTIETALAIVDAQREYARRDWDGDGLLVYAAKFASSPGKKDGLYWKAKEGEPESPLGPLVAEAQAEGYGKSGAGKGAPKGTGKAAGKGGERTPRPFHGYEYRILTAQGPDAPGGAYDYLVRGKLLGGFALLVSPAQYGVTGVMTFIVNHEGVVYEKDLGPDTSTIVRGMKVYNPDKTWKEAKRG